MNNYTEDKGFTFHFGPDVLYIEFKVPMDSNSIDNASASIKVTFPNTNFKIVAYKNIIGYWASYVLGTGESIYCGTMSLKDTKEKIKKYLEDEK